MFLRQLEMYIHCSFPNTTFLPIVFSVKDYIEILLNVACCSNIPEFKLHIQLLLSEVCTLRVLELTIILFLLQEAEGEQ